MTPEESTAWHKGHPGGSFDILPSLRDLLLPRVPSGGTYLEVGTFFGRSLSFVGAERPDLHLVAIDQWLDEWDDAGERLPVGPDRERRDKYGGMFKAFVGTMQEHAPDVLSRATVLRGRSIEILRTLAAASADLVFLDGDHTYDGLKADIEEGLRIVRPGGILAGHDFTRVSWGGDVQRAVRDMLLFRVGGKGYELAPWPVEREGWESGSCSVWYAKGI